MELGRTGPACAAAALLLLLLLAAPGEAEFDPYRVLGVGRGSSQADIKKAYKRLAREWYVGGGHGYGVLGSVIGSRCSVIGSWDPVIGLRCESKWPRDSDIGPRYPVIGSQCESKWPRYSVIGSLYPAVGPWYPSKRPR